MAKRQTALGRLLAAVLVLVLAWLCLGTSLTPGQTIRRAERLCGLEETHLLRQESIAGVTLSFSENDDAFLVTTHRLDWRLNWWNISTPLLLIDRGKEDPHCQAGALTFFDQDEKTDTVFLFGWTDLPDFPKAFPEDGDKPLLVEFWAPWCGYCRRIGPAYEQVAQQYGQDLEVCKINIDDEPALADREGIEVVPTLVLYQQGKAAGDLVAPTSKAAIDAFLQDHLPKKEGK